MSFTPDRGGWRVAGEETLIPSRTTRHPSPMPPLDESFPALLAALADRYGRPTSVVGPFDRFEAIVAVWLARVVEPRKVESALAGLRDAGLLAPDALGEADPLEVADALRMRGMAAPAKVIGPLQRLARRVAEWGSAEALDDLSTERLRQELLGVNGIGPASADAILLRALHRPVFPVERASYRVLVRHGWLDPSADYEEARAIWERPARDDPGALARLSAALESVGREFCRASVAKCENCPLRPFLPDGGPREPDA